MLTREMFGEGFEQASILQTGLTHVIVRSSWSVEHAALRGEDESCNEGGYHKTTEQADRDHVIPSVS